MRGFFGIGVFHSKNETNIGTLWRSAYAFGADYIFTVGKRYRRQPTDTNKAVNHVPLFHFSDIDDLVKHLPFGCQLVGVEIVPESVSLPKFIHPERACYLLGAEDEGLSGYAIEKCHRIIEIPGAAFCLNVATAGSIVLYDRVRRGRHE